MISGKWPAISAAGTSARLLIVLLFAFGQTNSVLSLQEAKQILEGEQLGESRGETVALKKVTADTAQEALLTPKKMGTMENTSEVVLPYVELGAPLES